MTTSMARIEANRRNAARSTGPKTEEGKAASRLNAFQHGMAGQGDLVRPADDEALMARRAEAFGRELGAVGAMGMLLARRAAVLSVRMETLATRDLIVAAGAEQQGRAEFAAERDDAIAELLAEARTTGAAPDAALAELLACPDGVAGLVGAWRELIAQLRSAEPGEAAEVAGRWLGRQETAPAAEWARRAEAEVGRLWALAGTMGAQVRAIEQARADAGRLARFDPGPEATLARRYEAAAERGMYRAIRAIADLNRQAGRADAIALGSPTALDLVGMAPLPDDLAERFSPRPQPPEPAELASFRPSVVEPLASFRPGAGLAVATDSLAQLVGPATRKPRPDLGKLDRMAARGRR